MSQIPNKAPSDYKKRSRQNYDMDTIRGMYGSTKVKKTKGKPCTPRRVRCCQMKIKTKCKKYA